MAILHKNISAEGDIHNPKWFSGANNGDVAWRNELGVLESTDELVLPAALNFVDGSVAPPTSNSGDIYVLSSGASVNAGWGTVALGDWVRYNGTTWNVITPQKSTLCYNETLDKLFSYSGSVWAEVGGGGGGGNTIYTANDSLTGNRVVDLDLNKLTFDVGAATSSSSNIGFNVDATNIVHSGTGTVIFNIDGPGGNLLYLTEKGAMVSKSDNPSLISNFTNRDLSKGLFLAETTSRHLGTEFYFQNQNSNSQPYIYNVTLSSIAATRYHLNSTTQSHILGIWVNTPRAEFFRQGFSSLGFLVGSDSKVSTEDISLQGSTLIKGNGTSTGSALAIYDNDTTPIKLWDFLDNGDINLGVDSVVGIGANDLTFEGSGIFKLSNGAKSIYSTWATHTTLVLDNGNGATYRFYSANASATFNAGEFGIGGSGSNIPFRIFNTSSVALGSVGKGSLDTNYNVQTAGATLIGGSLDTKLGTNEISLDHTNYPKLKISNGTQEYWLIEGDGTGSAFASGDMYLYDATNSRKLIHFLSDGNIDFPNIPTSAPTKGVWNDGGTLKIA